MKREISQLLSPELSQRLSKNAKKRVTTGNSGSKVQAVLNFPSSSLSSNQSTTCATCGMTYYSHVSKDKDLHTKYHFNFINGIPWATSFCTNIIVKFVIAEKTPLLTRSGTIKTRKQTSLSTEAMILTIDKKSVKQVRRVEEILKAVNQELNAPSDCQTWKKELTDPIQGKAFVVVIYNRAIAICVTDPIRDTEQQCRWMIHRTQSVVPKQVNKLIKLGVSRIWVAPKWRRYGLATRLLEIVLKHSVYGIVLDKREIGFSQPSFSGGLLAKNFNGVMHKTGETLIPVYLEE